MFDKIKGICILIVSVLMFPVYSYAFIPASGVVTLQQINAMTAVEMWNNMITPVVRVNANGGFFSNRTNLPKITHINILNSLSGMANNQQAYLKVLDIALLVNPLNTQISTQITQVINEMNRANVFNPQLTNSVAIQGLNNLFPLLSSSADNFSAGMLNNANESAIPTLIFGTSNRFRAIVNQVQLQGSNNLNASLGAVAIAGGTIFAQGFAGGASTAGGAGILSSGQAGLGALTIAQAMDLQIKQMLSIPALSPPTMCACITTYCVCLAGRIGMLMGYIQQTSIQFQQKLQLDMALVKLGDDIVKAIDDKANKVTVTIKKTKELISQQKKQIFDQKEKQEHDALVKSDILTKGKSDQVVVSAAEDKVNVVTTEEVGKLLSKKTNLSARNVTDISRDFVKLHGSKYCSTVDMDAGYCWWTDSKEMQNADIKMSNLFVEGYSEKQWGASNVFINQIVNNNGLQNTSIPSKLIKESDSAKQTRQIQLELMSYSSIPLYLLTEIKNDRMMVGGLGAKLNVSFLGFGRDISLIDAYKYRTGIRRRDKIVDKLNNVIDKVKNMFSFSFPYQIKMIEARSFMHEMLLKNYKLQSKLSFQFAAINAQKAKASHIALQRAINDVDSK